MYCFVWLLIPNKEFQVRDLSVLVLHCFSVHFVHGYYNTNTNNNNNNNNNNDNNNNNNNVFKVPISKKFKDTIYNLNEVRYSKRKKILE